MKILKICLNIIIVVLALIAGFKLGQKYSNIEANSIIQTIENDLFKKNNLKNQEEIIDETLEPKIDIKTKNDFIEQENKNFEQNNQNEMIESDEVQHGEQINQQPYMQQGQQPYMQQGQQPNIQQGQQPNIQQGQQPVQQGQQPVQQGQQQNTQPNQAQKEVVLQPIEPQPISVDEINNTNNKNTNTTKNANNVKNNSGSMMDSKL